MYDSNMHGERIKIVIQYIYNLHTGDVLQTK